MLQNLRAIAEIQIIDNSIRSNNVEKIISQFEFDSIINIPAKFLSGGQKSDDAAARLNMLNKIQTNKPWKLTFSYGRALQEDALTNYALKDEEKVKKSLIKRAKLNHLATLGKLD